MQEQEGGYVGEGSGAQGGGVAAEERGEALFEACDARLGRLG